MSPLAAIDDRELAAPTGWAWYYGQTEAQVDALVANGLRIVDLDVESTARGARTVQNAEGAAT